MCGRVSERTDQLAELEQRAWPAVQQQKRKRIGPGRADMQEMDAKAVDFGLMLVPAVQERLALSPVVAIDPIADQRLEFGQLRALGGVIHRLFVGPTRQRQPGA